MRFIGILMIFMLGAEAYAVDEAMLAFGDLRGYLEPCGCDEKTNLGGVKRIKKILDFEKVYYKDLLVFGLGNNLDPDAPKSTRSIFVLRALKKLNLTATLFNQIEMVNKDFAANNGEKLNYVLSNLKGQPIKSVAKIRRATGWDIFGFLEPRDGNNAAPLSKELLSGWNRQKRKNAKTLLLYSGGDVQLAKLRDTGFFDRIIMSNSLPFSSPPSYLERVNYLDLIKDKGADIWMVPSGGQGLLRYDRARFEKPKTVFEISKEKECFGLACETGEPSFLKSAQYITWLDPSVGEQGQFEQLFEEYSNFASIEFEKWAEKRVLGLEGSRFAGSRSCQACHPSAYAAYQKSAHAKAYSTLVKAEKDRDLECVGCHVLGFTEDGGFASIKSSPHLANVQCENCHGPRKEHVQNPLLKPESNPKQICVSCHHIPHSSDFVYDDYWPKIQHAAEK